MVESKDIREINEKVKKESAFIVALTSEIGRVIVGQNYIIERLMIGLLADGHILLEGVPGLAKTLAVKTLSNAIQTKFQRLLSFLLDQSSGKIYLPVSNHRYSRSKQSIPRTHRFIAFLIPKMKL